MAAAALLAALVALVVASIALWEARRARRVAARPGRRAGGDDEALRDAWLEEIEARGEQVLARIAAAEDSLRRLVDGPGTGMGAPEQAQPVPPVNPASPAQPILSADPVSPVEPASVARPAPMGQPAPTAAGAAPGAPETASRVRALAAQGMDAASIARQLGIGRGEVELILGLPHPDRG